MQPSPRFRPAWRPGFVFAFAIGLLAAVGGLGSIVPASATVDAVSLTITNKTTNGGCGSGGALSNATQAGSSYCVSFSVSDTTTPATTPTGTVSISFSTGQGTGCGPITLSSGSGSCNVSSTSAGAKTIQASYSGTGSFAGASDTDTASHTVYTLTTTTITGSSPNPSVAGQTYTVSGTVTANSTVDGSATPVGTVVVTGDGLSGCSDSSISSGNWSCDITGTTAALRTLNATYTSSSGIFHDSSATPATHSEGRGVSSISITSVSTGANSVTGQTATVHWSISPAPSVGTSHVTITGAIGCTVDATLDQCDVYWTLAGSYNLQAYYDGDANFNAATSTTVAHTVDKAATTTSITNTTDLTSNETIVGAPFEVDFSVVVNSPGATPPGVPMSGTVRVLDGIHVVCLTALPATSCQVPSVAGDYALTVNYVGDANYATSTSASVAHTVIPKFVSTTTITNDLSAPTIVNHAYTVQVSVSGSAGTPTGSVSVTQNGFAGCTATLAGGTGQCDITPTTTGIKTLVANYGGDADYASSSSTSVKHTVSPKGTTTLSIVNVTPSPATVGDTYTVSWTLGATGGAGSPTGAITITATGSSDTCTANAPVTHCDIFAATAGTKSLKATYAGDSNFTGSTSATTNEVINKAPTTTTIINLADLATSSVVGTPYTVKWQVTKTATVALSGNVTVTANGKNACSAVFSAGQCNVTTNSAGTIALVAKYAGDANFLASASTPVNHDVTNPAKVDLQITNAAALAANSTHLGDPVEVDITAVHTGGPTPTGTVLVLGGSGCLITLSGGSGSCNVTSTGTGTQLLLAIYFGDANYNVAISKVATHPVIP